MGNYPPILSGIALKDPFRSPGCPRRGCPLVASDKPCLGKCSIEGIVYRATCSLCEDKQLEEGAKPHQVIHHQYIGETSRTLRVRSGQHFRDYHKSAREDRQVNSDQDQEEASSFMWDHMKAKHPGEKTTDNDHFKFEVVTGFRDPLTRQITEAIRIGQARDDRIFYNNKGESKIIMTLNRKSEVFLPRERGFSY